VLFANPPIIILTIHAARLLRPVTRSQSSGGCDGRKAWRSRQEVGATVPKTVTAESIHSQKTLLAVAIAEGTPVAKWALSNGVPRTDRLPMSHRARKAGGSRVDPPPRP